MQEKTADSPDEVMTVMIYQMDIERVRFSLAKYLRCRILKIEQQMHSIMHDSILKQRLSHGERRFLDQLNSVHETYTHETFIAKLKEDEAKKAVQPDYYLKKHAEPQLDEHVVCHPLEDIIGGAGTGIPDAGLAKDVILVMKYSSIRDHVNLGSVLLL